MAGGGINLPNLVVQTGGMFVVFVSKVATCETRKALDLEPPNETLLERFGHLLVNFAWQPALPPAQGALPQDEDDAANGYETDEEGPASASETHP